MSDLKNLLVKALDQAQPEVPVDPADDLARGRTRLRRRRAGTALGAAAVVLGVGLAPVALTNGGPPERIQAGSLPAGTSASQSPGPGAALPALDLVAYTGKQAPGYQVAETPEGWEIQGGNPTVLTLAPKGAADQSFTSFVGKLVVMLESDDAGAPTGASNLRINSRPGYFDTHDDTQILTYQYPDGRWIVIQAPVSLGWDGQRLAEFADGVKVLGNAEAGKG